MARQPNVRDTAGNRDVQGALTRSCYHQANSRQGHKVIHLLLAAALAIPVPDNTGVCLNPNEAELAALVNQYRVANGRAALPVSRWLSTTGQYHAWDLITNNPTSQTCNGHSWSSLPPLGVTWQAVCYTPDHAQAQQMWWKPFQISGGVYIGSGYENFVLAGTPAGALSWWQNSPPHNEVILQLGQWANVNFQGLGVGFVGSVAYLWFGDGANNGGLMQACPTEDVFANGFE